MIRRYRGWLILGFAGWTAFGLFFGLQSYVNAIYFGQRVSLATTLAVWLICGYAWMLLTPLVFYLAEKFFIQSGRVWRNIGAHFLFGSALSLAQLSVFIFARQMLLGNPQRPFSFSVDFQRLFVGEFHINLLIYWIVTGVWHLRLINRRYLERQRETARLALERSRIETQLVTAQLDALKMQLHPHFLFNTLNSISVLMRDDPAAANRMLVRLSDLLRAALRNEGGQEVALKDELEFLRGYLEIEQIRFQDRLKVDFAVEEETLEARVPNLILQPLVENAIKHGIAPRAEPGQITIRTRRENGCVELLVSDDGAGGFDPSKECKGIGLRNTRERLEKLYGEEQSFEILTKGERGVGSGRAGGGLQVRIRIPFRAKGDGE